jgi:phage FluMu gp28-like protein
MAARKSTAPATSRQDVPEELKINAPGDRGLLRASQRKWIEDKSDVKIADKGRRTGFTFGEAADDVLTAASKREAGGQNVYYIGTTLDMAREYIEACARWAVGFSMAAGAIGEVVLEELDDHGNSRSIQTFRIDFPSGFSIQALSSRPRSLRGRQGIVVIDEAAFQDDLEGLIKAAMALLILGGKVRIISTHNGEDNYFNELLKDARAGRNGYSVHRCTFQDAIDEGLYRTRCKMRGETWSKKSELAFVEGIRKFYRPNDAEELDCVPGQSGGAYLPLTMLEPIENADIEVVRFSFKNEFLHQPAHVRSAEVLAMCREQLEPILKRFDQQSPSSFGSDFGRNADLSVMWTGQVNKKNKRCTGFVLELRNCPFKQQEEIFYFIIDRLPRFSAGKLDARGNGQSHAEAMQSKYGPLRIEAVMLTRAWYMENWPKAKALVEDKDVDIPKDRDIQADLRSVKVVGGIPLIPDRIVGSDKNGRHGDAAIAFVLWCAAARAAPFEVGFTSMSGHPTDIYEPRADGRGRMRMHADDVDDDDDAVERTTW